jgi:hypothetical protein
MKSTQDLYFAHKMFGLYCIVIAFVYGYGCSHGSTEKLYLESTFILIWLYGVLGIIFFIVNFLSLPFRKAVFSRKTWKETGGATRKIIDFLFRDIVLVLGATVLAIAPYASDDLRSIIPVSLVGIAMIVYGLQPPISEEELAGNTSYQ